VTIFRELIHNEQYRVKGIELRKVFHEVQAYCMPSIQWDGKWLQPPRSACSFNLGLSADFTLLHIMCDNFLHLMLVEHRFNFLICCNGTGVTPWALACSAISIALCASKWLPNQILPFYLINPSLSS
jgi:hypothetical protein